MDLRYLKLEEPLKKSLPTQLIKESYLTLCRELEKQHPQENTRTLKELELEKAIKKRTAIKIHHSIWIGKRNIDLFIPSICSRSEPHSKRNFRGLAIEVDGDFHNHSSKMNRYNNKYNLLHRLNISLYTIENCDLKHPNVQGFLDSLKTLPRLDCRGRERVMRNIYLITLAKHIDSPCVNMRLSEDQMNLIRNINDLSRKTI